MSMKISYELYAVYKTNQIKIQGKIDKSTVMQKPTNQMGKNKNTELGKLYHRYPNIYLVPKNIHETTTKVPIKT